MLKFGPVMRKVVMSRHTSGGSLKRKALERKNGAKGRMFVYSRTENMNVTAAKVL